MDMSAAAAAALRRQRSIKQTIQFSHKDSADLLPLDGLKKLGTSKEGVSRVDSSNKIVLLGHTLQRTTVHGADKEVVWPKVITWTDR